jgi:hypothetical protein
VSAGGGWGGRGMSEQNTNNNEGKKWEDILPSLMLIKSPNWYENYYTGYNNGVIDSKKALQQAEKDGAVSLNPPSREELLKILCTNKHCDYYGKFNLCGNCVCDILDDAEAISQRIRGK